MNQPDKPQESGAAALDAILTDDRISQMRHAVLDQVESDVGRRRTDRRRRAMRLAAAAAVLVVVLAGAVLAGVRLGQSSTGSTVAARDESTGSVLAPATQGAAPQAPLRTAGPAAAPTAPSVPTDVATDRNVVTTGTINMRADDPERVADDLTRDVEGAGGRTDARSSTGGEKKSAQLTLRIPSERMDETVRRASGLGEVTSVRLQRDDVTGTVVDLDARIRAVQVSVDRLTAILERADTTEAVVAAEGALTSRQQELESLRSRRDSIGERVELSTLRVTIDAPSAADHGGFVGGLRDGWSALGTAARWIVVAAGAVLPWVALLAAIYIVYLIARRGWRARRH